MKMTMHIDDALMKRVMAATGVTAKTKVVDLALRELDRRSELKRLASKGLSLTAKELRNAFDPVSDLEDTLRCAESPVTYARKSGSR